MLFLNRRRSRVLQEHYNIPNDIHTMASPDRPSRSGLMKRVSTIFKTRKKPLRSRSAPLSNIAVDFPGSRYSSRSPSPLSPDIRRPSGLGRRASSVESLTSPSTEWPMDSERGRCLSSPEVLGTHTWLDGAASRNAPPPLDIPSEILDVMVSFSSPPDLSSLALVSRNFCTASRGALYHSLDLRVVREDKVEHLITVLASRREIASIVRTFVCCFPPSSPSTDKAEGVLAASRPLYAALKNMFSLVSLTLASVDVSILYPGLPFRLKHLTFLNETITPEEQSALLSWLPSQSGIHSLAFPNLVEKTAETNHDPANPTACLALTAATPTPTPLSPFFTIPPSSTLLPYLHTLHAPPTLTTLLAPITLTRATVDIDATLYNGLRPSALLAALRGVREISLRFGEGVDRRTVEKVMRAAGNVLGEGLLEVLEVRVRWVDTEVDETVYRIINSLLPRLRSLRSLRLYRPHRPIESLNSDSSQEPATVSANDPTPYDQDRAQEQTYLSTWLTHCPSLTEVVFLSGTVWPGTDTEMEHTNIPRA